MYWWVLGGAGYGLSAVLAYGIELAYWRREWPGSGDWRDYAGFSLLMATMGPIALVIALCLSGFARHGVLFWERGPRVALGRVPSERQ